MYDILCIQKRIRIMVMKIYYQISSIKLLIVIQILKLRKTCSASLYKSLVIYSLNKSDFVESIIPNLNSMYTIIFIGVAITHNRIQICIQIFFVSTHANTYYKTNSEYSEISKTTI